MKVFLDTNIFLEYFERRRQYSSCSQKNIRRDITRCLGELF